MMINTNNNLCKEVSKGNASYKKERLSCLLLSLAVLFIFTDFIFYKREFNFLVFLILFIFNLLVK